MPFKVVAQPDIFGYLHLILKFKQERVGSQRIGLLSNGRKFIEEGNSSLLVSSYFLRFVILLFQYQAV